MPELKTFREYFEQNIQETFNTSLPIIGRTPSDAIMPQFYYVNIRNEKFRIFTYDNVSSVEQVEIGFEHLGANGAWGTKGISNILNAKELLSLFGTIYKIVLENQYEAISIAIDVKDKKEIKEKKMRLYKLAATKLQKELEYLIDTSKKDKIIVYKEKKPLERYLDVKTAKMNRN